MSGGKRLFLGTRVSTQTANALAACAEMLQRRSRDAGVDMKWVAPTNYHVTLKFLGWTRDEAVPALVDALDEALVGVSAFKVRAARLGAFPSLQIRAHYKPRPHFVSDATLGDWDAALAALERHSSPALRAWWQRLDGALRSGRLRTATHAFWCRPSPWAELPADLRAPLSQAHVVVLKGDLNYRRYVEDRAWPHDTSTIDLWLPELPPVLALRVLKSELAVGLPRDATEDLSRAEPDWLFNGRNAVVQLFPSDS